MDKQNNYKVEIYFKDDKSTTLFGHGRPSKVDNQLVIEDANGEVEVFNFDLIRSFHVEQTNR